MGLLFLRMGLSPLIYIDSAVAENSVYREIIPKFINNGGEIIIRPVRIRDIRQAISGKYPVILHILNSDRGEHFVVVRNMGNKKATINDPLLGVMELDIKKMMEDRHDWSAGAIVVRP